MASAMAYFQANRGKLSGQISANVVSSSRTSEGINYMEQPLHDGVVGANEKCQIDFCILEGKKPEFVSSF